MIKKVTERIKEEGIFFFEYIFKLATIIGFLAYLLIKYEEARRLILIGAILVGGVLLCAAFHYLMGCILQAISFLLTVGCIKVNILSDEYIEVLPDSWQKKFFRIKEVDS